MKRMKIFVLLLIAMSLSTAGTAAQGAATPDATPAADTVIYMPSVEYIDEAGNVIAVMTVTDIEQDWTDYAEFYAPRAGNEFVRVTVQVESRVGRGTFTVEPYFFYLQDMDGFMYQAVPIPTVEEEAAGFDPFASILDLAGGETGELHLTFEVLSGVDLQALYFSPDLYTRLITVAEFDEE
ncbi:MAG TPA: DUF4352 domain-containing protein [Thermomicrobiales bacterium]|nr:DUF4352 domain-containing protein [Thermomicrobiales bacterium]